LLHWRANDAPFYASPQDKAFCAPYLLRELKPSANLLSDLVQTQLTSTNPVTRKVAIEILGAAGEGSERVVPSLVAGLQDQDPDCVHAAVFALARLGPASAPAVPALATMLKSETIADRRKLLGLALAQIGGAAKPAVPVIQPLFRNETDWYDRCKWAGYLCKIDSNQTEALNFLIDGATNRESTNDAEAAISVLSTIGPNARPAASVCLAILSSPTNDFWSEAAAALEKMNAPKEMYLPALKTRLHSRNDGLTAAKLIFSLDPNDQDAIAVLIQSLRNCGPDQLEVFVELGSAGPMAAPAIPAIEEALKNKEPQIRDVARWGLRQIQTNSAPK
jgi:HEAT repeat protein